MVGANSNAYKFIQSSLEYRAKAAPNTQTLTQQRSSESSQPAGIPPDNVVVECTHTHSQTLSQLAHPFPHTLECGLVCLKWVRSNTTFYGVRVGAGRRRKRVKRYAWGLCQIRSERLSCNANGSSSSVRACDDCLTF